MKHHHPGSGFALKGPVWNCSTNWAFQCCEVRDYVAAVCATENCSVCGRVIHRPPRVKTYTPICPPTPWPGCCAPQRLAQLELFG